MNHFEYSRLASSARNYLILLGLLVSYLMITSLSLFASDATTETDTAISSSAIVDAHAAVKRVLQYTGFKEAKQLFELSAAKVSQYAKVVTITDDRTPYLGPENVSKRAWMVTLSGVKPEFKSWRPDFVAKQPPREFFVLIDSASGVLLRVYTVAPRPDTTIAMAAPADSSTALLRQTGEQFHGYPINPPEISFEVALDKAPGCEPVTAKELDAVYVMWSNMGSDPRPAWSIIGRGVSPIHGWRPFDKLPIWKQNSWRTVVDAETGERLSNTNFPWEVRYEDTTK